MTTNLRQSGATPVAGQSGLEWTFHLDGIKQMYDVSGGAASIYADTAQQCLTSPVMRQCLVLIHGPVMRQCLAVIHVPGHAAVPGPYPCARPCSRDA